MFDNIRLAELMKNYRSGANWFYWIAALSIITSLIAIGGGGIHFIFSLGITQVIDGIAAALSVQMGSAAQVVALVLDLIIVGIFVLFGYLANRKQLWAYIVGSVLFLLDGLLCLIGGDIISSLAHAVVIFFLIRGIMAGRELFALEKAMAQQAAAPQTEPAL
jgi:hypothetical protein